jgi:hypothetical protein
MAVVATNYIRRGKVGNDRAKDAIRYMQHRPEREGERITRPLSNHLKVSFLLVGNQLDLV